MNPTCRSRACSAALISRPAPPNEFRVADLKPGQIKRVTVDGQGVAVYNVEGTLRARRMRVPTPAGC
ncbi:hypothetical protein [Candidatus Amarolinea aalborgensis]|uniref:hypothetical protein n=1 Tax=Candidatus Amarolinea aalborgensis TaxID=2249329 RepID=UPI003BFA22FE